MNTTDFNDRLKLEEGDLFEEETTDEAKTMTDEELKIESLKIATNIAKLMSNVTTEDIVDIAGTVAKFIKGDASEPVETNDEEESTEESSEENSEESSEEPSDSEEDFEL